MQKWEYLQLIVGVSQPYLRSGKPEQMASANGVSIMEGGEKFDVYNYLNNLGKEGWELVSTDANNSEYWNGTTYYFKRPLKDK